MSTTEAEDVLGLATAWREAGEQVALATVTETWGSSPRPAGRNVRPPWYAMTARTAKARIPSRAGM